MPFDIINVLRPKGGNPTERARPRTNREGSCSTRLCYCRALHVSLSVYVRTAYNCIYIYIYILLISMCLCRLPPLGVRQIRTPPTHSYSLRSLAQIWVKDLKPCLWVGGGSELAMPFRCWNHIILMPFDIINVLRPKGGNPTERATFAGKQYICLCPVVLYVSLSVTSSRHASNQNPPNPQLQFKILGPNLSQGS